MSSRRALCSGLAPIHLAVAGRARIHVEGLRGSERVKAKLVGDLVAMRGMRQVTGSIWTGNLLITFEPPATLDRILGAIDKSLDRAHRVPLGARRPALMTRSRGSNPGPRAGTAATIPPHSPPPLNGRVPALGSLRPWHLVDASFTLSGLATDRYRGLSSGGARERLARLGPNVLAPPSATTALGTFVKQFGSLPVALLTAAAALSLATGGLADATVIMGVVLLNAIIGTVTERRAERTISALDGCVQTSSLVVRDGVIREVAVEDIVIGDVLALMPGALVPADARIIESRDLTVDESLLTGESAPVTKTSERLVGARIALGDRINVVYRGTAVTSGRGLAVVVATGQATEVGQIQALASAARPPETPMQRQLGEMGRQLVWLSCAACGLVGALGLLRGYGLVPMLKTSISLAVAAVPEGLPAIATTTLALGVHSMRRHDVLIRRLEAVETLGAVQVVCLDKTGTLTLNRMSVVALTCSGNIIRVVERKLVRNGHALEPSAGADLIQLLELAALCSEADLIVDNGGYTLRGSPTEAALIEAAIDAGVDVSALRRAKPLLATNGRTEGRRMMSTLHNNGDGTWLCAVKGNPVDVLGCCRWYLRDGSRHPLTGAVRDAIARDNDRMGREGLRILGVAWRELAPNQQVFDVDLTWVGLIGLADPPRRGMRELMALFHGAGLHTTMITGDQRATAYGVAKALDLSNGRPIEILDAADLEQLPPERLSALARRAHVFARVSPAHKLQIVQALQRAGMVAAMTGDGINDSPALKAADIGIAMGEGSTDAARHAADVVLASDDVTTMAVAIGHGRTVHSNIRKSVHYLLATNTSEVIVMLGAVAAGLGQPLSPLQLLWINLITDVAPAIGLALEPPEPDVLARPPRNPQEPIVRLEDFRRIGLEAAVIGASALGACGYGLWRYGMGPTVNTITLGSLTTAQLLHALSARSDRHSWFGRVKLQPNRPLHVTLGLSLGAQLATMLLPPLRRLLGVVPISPLDGLVMLAAGTLPFFINEASKIQTARSRETAAVGELAESQRARYRLVEANQHRRSRAPRTLIAAE